MVSLILPQKTATPTPQHKQSDVIEEPVDVDDKALTSKGNYITTVNVHMSSTSILAIRSKLRQYAIYYYHPPSLHADVLSGGRRGRGTP